MRRWLPVLSMAAVAGCASSSASTTTEQPAGPIEGTYDYTATLPGQQVIGKLRVVGDTIIVMPTNDYCQPVIGMPSPLVIRYNCNGPGRYESMTLTLDRPDPDWIALARGYGVEASRATTLEALARELKRALSVTGPYLVELVM